MAMKSKKICIDCGRVYLGGENSHYCPQCFKKVLSKHAKELNLNKLGNEAYSKLCAERRARK